MFHEGLFPFADEAQLDVAVLQRRRVAVDADGQLPRHFVLVIDDFGQGSAVGLLQRLVIPELK